MRTQRKLAQKGKLLDYRRELLNYLGFEYDATGSEKANCQWNVMQPRLLRFKAGLAHTNIPHKFQEGRILGQWLNYQHQLHREGKLSESHLEKVESVVFMLESTTFLKKHCPHIEGNFGEAAQSHFASKSQNCTLEEEDVVSQLPLKKRRFVEREPRGSASFVGVTEKASLGTSYTKAANVNKRLKRNVTEGKENEVKKGEQNRLREEGSPASKFRSRRSRRFRFEMPLHPNFF